MQLITSLDNNITLYIWYMQNKIYMIQLTSENTTKHPISYAPISNKQTNILFSYNNKYQNKKEKQKGAN